jgi:hypothetical protein
MLGQPPSGELGGPGERGVFGLGGRAPVDEPRAAGTDLVDLRASVEAEVQAPWTPWPRPELVVDVVDVGAADDEDVDSLIAEGLEPAADCSRVSPTARHRRSVPVEQEGLEPPIESFR